MITPKNNESVNHVETQLQDNPQEPARSIASLLDDWLSQFSPMMSFEDHMLIQKAVEKLYELSAAELPSYFRTSVSQ